MASFIPYLSDHRNKDGSYTIGMRITTFYDTSKISLQIRILKDQWNPKKKEVRVGHPEYDTINKAVDRLKSELERIYYEAKQNGAELNAKEIRILYEERMYGATAPPAAKVDFFKFSYDYFDKLEAAGKYNTVRSRRSIIGKLKAWLGKEVIAFEDITVAMLEDYRLYLESELKNGKNTVHGNFKRLNEQFRRANRQGLTSHNPFDKIKIEKGKVNRAKLSRTELDLIVNRDLVMDTEDWHIRNFFLFSFYCAGIRWGDICTLMWPMIHQQRLKYNMGKTGLFRDMKLHKKAQSILWHYFPDPLAGHGVMTMNNSPFPRQEKSALIFPILSDEWRKALRPYEEVISKEGIISLPAKMHYDLKGAISSRNVIANEQLKHLAEVCKIKKPLSFHISRHTFADMARKKQLSIQVTSELLGHSSISTTQQYFGKGFDDDVMDDALDLVID